MCGEMLDGYKRMVEKEVVKEYVVMGKWMSVGYLDVQNVTRAVQITQRSDPTATIQIRHTVKR